MSSLLHKIFLNFNEFNLTSRTPPSELELFSIFNLEWPTGKLFVDKKYSRMNFGFVPRRLFIPALQ
jgi:hypothetical protein